MNIKLLISFSIVIIILIISLVFNNKYNFISNNYNDIIKKYNLIRSNNLYGCLSQLSDDTHNIILYYKYIDLIHLNEMSTNMYLKSKISIKMNLFNGDITLNNIFKLCSYAKERNIFIWISALYKTTLDDEYKIYNKLRKTYNNVGITLSCSHSSVSKKVDEILKFNGNIRLVKGLYKGNIINDNKIKQLFITNSKKLCNATNYQCICTHDFNILTNLELTNNKYLELSFYFKNINYVIKNLVKYNINISNISMYISHGNKLLSLFDSNIKIPYYYKKKFNMITL